MRLSLRARPGTEHPGVSGTARVDRRWSAAVARCRPGDILVLDQPDLDRAAADAILARGVAGVVNAGPAVSGRFPTLGPEILVRAGVVLIDLAGEELLARVKDGAPVRLSEGQVLQGADEVVASGRVLDVPDVAELRELARSGMATQLASFTHNTTEFLRREHDLLLNGRGVPDLATPIAGRGVVVVVRDFDHESDLRGLRSYIRERRPVLVGVDAGADALLAAGHRPDVVVVGEAGLGAAAGPGSGQEVSDAALRAAREVVLHADSSDRVVGGDRLDRLGIRPFRVAASGSAEDVALLVADRRGAALLVTVGSHVTLDDLLDKSRAGLPSTFLTRLRVSSTLVDAKAAAQLHATRFTWWQLLLVLLAGLLAVGAAVAATPVGQEWADQLLGWAQDVLDAARGLLP